MKGKIHFIAIGGSAMHNLAIALNRNGYEVTGSDDEIFEPSRSRLEREGILPEEIGWYPEKITEDLEAVILGMHARADNPELAKAKQMGIRIFSYPEYLYEQSKNKQRVVIGGSHGKTTITSMLLHGMKELNVEVDYMVGAQLDGYDCMVQITDSAPFMILEGDEYLSSPIDRRPKFHLYKPNIALVSGIAWDHINVFPTFENYVEQFRVFADLIEDSGSLIYNAEDPNVKEIGEHLKSTVQGIPYGIPDYSITDNGTVIHYDGSDFPLKIFGGHNLQNLMGAMHVASKMGVEPKTFLGAMKNFTGAGKRLQSVLQSDELLVYKDFAHSPSKLKATTKAVKEQYANKRLIACMELHTFSSLQKDFLPQYSGAMDTADMAMVYFSPDVLKHKRLPELDPNFVQEQFGSCVQVVTTSADVLSFIQGNIQKDDVLLLMSSGNFDGVDYDVLADQLLQKIRSSSLE